MNDTDKSKEQLIAELVSLRRQLAECRQVEQTLQDSAELHQVILANISDAVIITDDTGAFTYISPGVETIVGYSSEEVGALGNITALLGGNLFDRAELESCAEVRDIECEITHKNGTSRILLITIKHVSIKEGTRLYVCHNITGYRRLQRALQEHELRLRTLIGNLPIVLFAVDREGLFTLSEGQEWKNGFVPGRMMGKSVFDLFKGVPGVAETIQRVLNGEIATLRGETAGAAFEAYYTPLKDDYGQIVGVIGVAMDVTERQQIENKLKEAEARHRVLFEQSPDGIMILDPDTTLPIEFNKVIPRLLGYPADEFARLQISDYEVIETPDEVDRHIQKILHQGFDTFETRHRTKSGEIKDVLVYTQTVEFSGRPAFHSIIRDITERKQAEISLKASESFNRAILNSLSSHLVVLNKQGLITAVNEAWNRFAAENDTASPEQVGLGQNYFEVCRTAAKDDDTSAAEVLAGLLAVVNGSIDRFEFEYPCDSPTEKRWFQLRAVPLLTTEGGLVISHINITRQRLAEQASRQATQRYRQLFEEAPAMYIINRDEDNMPVITDCNELFIKTLGYSREEILQKPTYWFYTSDSLAKLVGGGYQRARRGEFTAEERELVTRDGRIIETMIMAVPEIDVNNQITGTRAMYIDISERKNLERQLEAIYRHGQELTLLRDEATIIHRVLETATTLLDFEIAGCALIDDLAQNLVFRYARINGQPQNTMVPYPLTEERGIGVAVVRSGRAINVPDVRQDPRYVPPPNSHTGQSELCVPLKVGSRVIGVLATQSSELNHFTRSEQQLLQTLADQAAIALENLRLNEETQRQTRELSALNKAIRVMTSSLELHTALDHILEQLAQVVAYDTTSLMLVSGDLVKMQAVRGFKEPERILAITSKIADYSLFQQMIDSGRPIVIPDVETNADFQKWTGTEMIRSWIGVPLIVNDQVIGQLSIDKHQPNFYNEKDAELAFTFAQQAATAIENARLHAETKRRAQQLVVLHELDWIITASLRIEDIYLALAHHTARLFPYDYMSIALLREEGVFLAYVKSLNGSTEPPVGTILPGHSSVTTWVAKQGHPLLRHSITEAAHFAEDQQLLAMNIHSAMIIPLRVKGQVFGTWNIGNQQINAYNPDDLAIAGSMGDQLAIAIENARLYEAEREQFHRLQQSQAQLIQVEKMAALGRLVASIAHEINNPIQAIQNALTLVEEELADSRQEKVNLYIDIAKNEFERIAAIVRRMRDFYRSAKPHVPVFDSTSIDDFYLLSGEELQNIDLHAILDKVLKLANKQLQHGGIKVECLWAESLPIIRGSPDQLQQVFLNLTLNAFDAMLPQRGGTLYIRTRQDQLALPDGQPQAAARIEFSDTGPGMPPELLSRIFEPLFTTKEQGSGFGLFTSFKIVEAHQGQITAESQPGLGTTFTILLPGDKAARQ